jgi:hypothetical protein
MAEMQDSKLYKWIHLLSTQEQNDFVRFVEHAGGKSRQELHGLILLFIQEVVRGKENDRELFFQKWRPGTTTDINYLRKRMTKLQELLDSFLAAQELAQNHSNEVVFLAKALERRGWNQFIEREHRDALAVLASHPVDDQHFWQKLQLESAYLNLTLEQARSTNGPTLQTPLDLVEQHYLSQALRFACAAQNQDRIVGSAHDYGLLPLLLPHIASRIDRLHPLVRIYYRVYSMQESPTDRSHYEALLDELQRHAEGFAQPIARELYKYAINHCVRRFNAGELDFSTQLGSLYTYTLAKGLLLRNGQIAAEELKNIIGLTARIGQLALAEQLLAEYSPKLSPNADPAAIAYCNVVILYYKGEYSAARYKCEEVMRDTRDPFLEIDARVYHWRASYELLDFDFGAYQHQSFRMFLRRMNTLGHLRIQGYKQFVQFFSRLYLIVEDLSPTADKAEKKKKLEKLLADIEASDNVMDATWLKAKIAQALSGL